MADTSELTRIKRYVVQQLSEKMGIKMTNKAVKLKTGKSKNFDGVTEDGDIVVTVLNHSGRTSGGKKPSGKVKNAYADCYFLALSNATRKLIVCTNEDFYTIFKKDSEGLLGEIELVYFELPNELQILVNKITSNASKEMTNA